MRNRTLFVLHRIGIGGSMTSMLNLLELLKENGLEVDLFLMEHEGVFLERAKFAANLLPEDTILASIICDKRKLIKTNNYLGLILRIIYFLAHQVLNDKFVTNCIFRWRAKKYNRKYTNVVAYQENTTTEFVQYIKAINKVAWIHNDYERFVGNDTVSDMQKLYDRFDKIVCVSEAAKISMSHNLVNVTDKICLIYNALNPSYIRDKSCEYEFEMDNDFLNFVSVGRFAPQKCFDRIVEVSGKLIKLGYEFKWYIVGDGFLFENIKERIQKEYLENTIILLGAKKNPYPIIKAADYVVVTSSYEAHPMVANEALILGKPVLSTAFSSVSEVINEDNNGIICENNTIGIFNGIKRLIDDNELQRNINKGAQGFTYNNNLIISKVLKLLS